MVTVAVSTAPVKMLVRISVNCSSPSTSESLLVLMVRVMGVLSLNIRSSLMAVKSGEPPSAVGGKEIVKCLH